MPAVVISDTLRATSGPPLLTSTTRAAVSGSSLCLLKRQYVITPHVYSTAVQPPTHT